MKLVLQRTAGDCGISALATLIEQSYEDCYVAISDHVTRGRSGMSLQAVRATAKRLGVRMKYKKHPNLEDDEGLLVVKWKRPHKHPYNYHLVVLSYGVVADPADGYVLPAEDFMLRFRGIPGSLLEIQ